MGRRWTNEDEDVLERYWGEASLALIAKKLNRTENSVRQKAHAMKLGPIKEGFDGFALNDLAMRINVDKRKLYRWISQQNFPARKTKFTGRVYMIRTKQFWSWAKENRKLLDFAEIEPLILGPEPDWVKDKRKADEVKKQRYKNNGTPWSKEDDELLISLCKSFLYTYSEISARLFRTTTSIKYRVKELGIKYRPIPMTTIYPEDIFKERKPRKWNDLEKRALKEMVTSRKFNVVDISRELDRSHPSIINQIVRLNLPWPIPYVHYSDEESKKICQMFWEDFSISEIAEACNRSEEGIRHHLHRLGHTSKIKEELKKELIG